jgi:hypothetical protein
MQLAQADWLSRQIVHEGIRHGSFWGVGRRHSDSSHQPAIQITQHMALVAIDALVGAFASMTHLGILDRHVPLFGHFAPQGGPTLGSQFDILRPFHDRHYNRDLVALCHRVNAAYCHLPDGRVLLFSVQDLACPLVQGQER